MAVMTSIRLPRKRSLVFPSKKAYGKLTYYCYFVSFRPCFAYITSGLERRANTMAFGLGNGGCVTGCGTGGCGTTTCGTGCGSGFGAGIAIVVIVILLLIALGIVF
jgi:hypothetical protein